MNNNNNNEQGHSMIEFMVVITLSLLIGSTAMISMDKVRSIATKQEMQIIKHAIVMYEIEENKLPNKLKALSSYLSDGYKTDAFGSDYTYDKNTRELCSVGLDPIVPECINF